MLKKYLFIGYLFLNLSKAFGLEDSVPLQVWVNEAIINTFTFNDTNLLARQKDMAIYFTADAWKVYLDTLHRSNILQQVEKNHFQVSAVATMPPVLTAQADGNRWKIDMPVLVKYQNKEKTLQQNLTIHLEVIKTTSKDSRGFEILQYEAKIIDNPCACEKTYPKVTIA